MTLRRTLLSSLRLLFLLGERSRFSLLFLFEFELLAVRDLLLEPLQLVVDLLKEGLLELELLGTLC